MNAPWTDERVAILKRMWAAGHTASEIAAHLRGTTRNSVIGKLHRLGLSKREMPRPPKVEKPKPAAVTPKAPKPETAAPKPASKLRAVSPPKAPPLPKPESLKPQASRNVPIADLRRAECRFPVTDDPHGDHRFCGARTVPGESWCEAHKRVVYAPETDRKRKKARDGAAALASFLDHIAKTGRRAA